MCLTLGEIGRVTFLVIHLVTSNLLECLELVDNDEIVIENIALINMQYS